MPKKYTTIRSGDTIMGALKREGSVPAGMREVPKGQPYSGKPSFETLSRIGRATKVNGKEKALGAKDYRRAKKQVKKLKKNNRRKFLGLF